MKGWSLVGLAALAAGYASLPAAAADTGPIPAPALKAGDSWVVDEMTELPPSKFNRQRLDVSIERVGSDNMVVDLKPDGAQIAPQSQIRGLDWGQLLLVDGQQKPTMRPLSFPLQIGKSWSIDWVDPRQSGNRQSAHIRETYKVVGWEDVTVPAGAFHALKIEANGSVDEDVVVPSVAQSTAVGAPGSATALSHVQQGGRSTVHLTLYSVTYYAPEAKRFVKTVDEQFNASGVRVRRTTEELVSLKLAG